MRPLDVIAAGALVLCVGCSPREPELGLFVYTDADPFMKAFADEIVHETKGSFALQLRYASDSQSVQDEQIDALLKDKPALMMINQVDRLGAFAVVRRLKEAQVPVIFFNRQPLPEDLALWDQAYYVGARAEQSAQFQVDMVAKLFGGDPAHLNRYDRNHDGRIQTIILKGEQGHQDAETRTDEVLRSFTRRGFQIDILAVEIADWSSTEAYSKMGRLLAKYQGRVELVVSNNDAMALGAISRMQEAGYFAGKDSGGHVSRFDPSWVPVVGIDGLPEALESVKEGYLYGTVKNDSETMARVMAALAKSIEERRVSGAAAPPLPPQHYYWIDYQPCVAQD